MSPIVSLLLVISLAFFFFMKALISLKIFNATSSRKGYTVDEVKPIQIKYIGTAFLLSLVMCTGLGQLFLALLNTTYGP